MLLPVPPPFSISLFFFNDTATTEIYTLSLHDALPISLDRQDHHLRGNHHQPGANEQRGTGRRGQGLPRSEEHTSELQSRLHLVCRLLLEKKTEHTLWHVPFEALYVGFVVDGA